MIKGTEGARNANPALFILENINNFTEGPSKTRKEIRELIPTASANYGKSFRKAYW